MTDLSPFLALLDERGVRYARNGDVVSVGESLYLRGCTGLTSLPDNLSVGGWLGLRGCTGLLGTIWRGRTLAIVEGYTMALVRRKFPNAIGGISLRPIVSES